MKRHTFWIAIGLVGCLNTALIAQTTGTTTPTTTRTASTASAIGTGAGIGTDTTNGASFSGGQGGQGMAGGAGFSGGTAFTGGQGGTQQQGGGRAGTTTTTTPTTQNPFRATYKPYNAAGAGSTKAFGQPILASVTTTQAGGQAGGFARGGAAGGFGGAATSGLQGMGAQSTGFSTVGIRRAPSYTTTLGRGVPIINVPAPALLGQLRTTLQATTELASKSGVQIAVEGSTVVLRGRVEDESERRLTEAIVRLTPGVREIRNELIPAQK